MSFETVLAMIEKAAYHGSEEMLESAERAMVEGWGEFTTEQSRKLFAACEGVRAEFAADKK